jgi:hypothetical protein
MSTGAPIPPPNPGYQNFPPPSAPSNSGNTVLKIVLIVIGIFVFLGVLITGIITLGVYKVSKAVHQNKDGGVSLSTPNGTITTGKSVIISDADLGTVPYPGATVGDGSMNMKTPNGSMVTSVYTSSDSQDKIVAFYKEKFGDQASVVQTSNGTMLSSGENDKDKVMVTITTQDGVSKIVIIHITKTNS